MRPTIDAVIDKHGKIKLLEKVSLHQGVHVLVTLLEDRPMHGPMDLTLLSESALGRDWNRKEEDAAWAHLQ